MIARIIELCARHRLIVLAGVGLALVGALLSMRRLQIDALPDLSDPQVIVFSEWMGRSPTLVEDQVTYPIVAKLLGTPRVADVRGYSMFGMSFVYVVFEEGTDLYWARSRVLEYLSGLRGALPEGVAPTLGPDASGVGWIFQYALVDKSGARGLDELRTLQDFTLRYALGTVPGVAEVASIGGYERQYQVTVDPDRLRAHGLSLDEVTAAIRASNEDTGGRILEMGGREYYVRGRGYIKDLASIEQIVLRGPGPSGAPLLVRDVATVRFGPEMRRGLLEWNGEGEAVGGIVVMRHGENALEVIERVKRKIEDLKPGLPPGLEIAIAYDRSGLIERSLATLRRALVEEAITVSLVIVLFLLHLRSSLLPILSLPIAVALSFIPMALLDIPSTIMSLGGIAIAIGATVDAEIVMIEAAHKKLEHAPPGADTRRLLAEAAREVTPAIFFSLLIIAVAFLPVFTLTGQAGRLFRPLAWTKTFVMLISALLSITFAPALRDLLIRGRIRPEKDHPLSRFVIRIYKPFVFVALRNPKSTLAIGALAVLSAVPLGLRLGREFMPPLDEGDLLYMPTTFPNISIEEAKRQLQIQDRLLRGFPEVESVFGKVGRAETATDPAPLTMVETTIRLRPRDTWRERPDPRFYSGWAPSWLEAVLRPLWPDRRRITPRELAAEMNARLALPGWTNAWTMPIKARVDMLSTGVRTPVGIKVFGTDLAEIERVGVALERLLAPVPGTRSVFYERSTGGLYVDVVPRPEALARHGLRVADIGRVVEQAIGGAPITTTVEGRSRFSVSVRLPQDVRGDVEALKQIPVPVGPGSGGAGAPMGPGGALFDAATGRPVFLAQLLAQAMPMGGGASGPMAGPEARPSSGGRGMSDAPPGLGGGEPGMGMGTHPSPASGMGGAGDGTGMRPPPAPGARWDAGGFSARAFVPLGALADVVVTGGPPMLRDEAGLLVGYVYVDVDEGRRDVGGYVDEAKSVVTGALGRGALALGPGMFLEWTGQYEQLAEMTARMKLVVPATLLLVLLLLVAHFRSLAEALIVLLSIPFALVGSVWLLWLLDYRLSTAVWVGVIALVGLAAQTGIVMIVYIDHAYERRKAAGKIRDLSDIVWAHMEGTVLRVRPKLMTVSTMLVGLLPLLWADTAGSDVMKRIAAPMVGGLATSTFLTLELIPVVYTYWRYEQLLWERAGASSPARLARLRVAARVAAGSAAFLVLVLASRLYVTLPGLAWPLLLAAGLIGLVGGLTAYAAERPAARRLAWPEAR